MVWIAWVASAALALVAGLALRARDRRSRPTGATIDFGNLTPLQVAYTVLLAYPFCVVWVLIDLALR